LVARQLSTKKYSAVVSCTATKILYRCKLIQAAGGKIKDKGHFAPGEPFVFFYDPDGYEVEVFFENLPERLKDFN